MSLNKIKKPINITSSVASLSSVAPIPSTTAIPVRKNGKSRCLQQYSRIREILNNGNQLHAKELATFWKLQSSKLECNINFSMHNFNNKIQFIRFGSQLRKESEIKKVVEG